jgi:uncharacterized protein YggE
MMASRTLQLAGIVAALTLAVGGYCAPTDDALPANVITIVASGVAKGTPDMVTIRLPITSTAPLGADAMAQTRKKTDDLIAQLTAAKVPNDAIQRSGVVMSASSEMYGGAPQGGLMVGELVTVTLKGAAMANAAERVSAVLDAMTKNGISIAANQPGGSPFALWGERMTSASVISFTVSDKEAFRSIALENAVANARKAADGLAKTLGVKIERVRGVEMLGGPGYDLGCHTMGLGDDEIVSLSAMDISTSVSVKVAFEFSR